MADSNKRAPHDLDAEQALIGAAMQSEAATQAVLEYLHPDDFFVESHRVIAAAIFDLGGKGEAVDLLTLTARLREQGNLKKVGGASALSMFYDSIPDVGNSEHYALIVRDMSCRRSLIEIGRAAAMGAIDEKPIAELLDTALDKMLTISEKAHPGRIRNIGEVAKDVVNDAITRQAEPDGGRSIMTGIDSLDNATALRFGKTVVIAGTTSAGKTALALQVADNVARTGKQVMFFTLEMSEEELTERVLAARAGVPVERIEKANLDAGQIDKLEGAVNDLLGVPLWIDDSPGMTPLEVRAKARQHQLRHGLDMVVVDYLQRMSPGYGSRGRSREQEVSEMSRHLKLVARSLNVPVFVLSQLSRKHENENRAPELYDLRESGAIEQDADIVMMLYRPDREEPDTALFIRKNRQGPLGRIELKFDGTTTRFTDPANIPW